MLQVNFDHSTIEEMLQKKIDEKVEELAKVSYFMNSKEVLRYVNMSWNSFVEHILCDPNFNGSIRLGSKWLFNRKELDAYLDKFFIAVRDSGGDIQKYTKR